MPTRNQSHIAIYRAYNTLSGLLQSADVGNHTLLWSKDGAAGVAVTNAPSARATAGFYQVVLTASEADCEVGTLIGTSTTSSVVLETVRFAYDLPVTLTPSQQSALRADGLVVRLATLQDLYAPAKAGDEMALTTATFNALFSDTDINGLVTALLQSIETELDVGDLSVQAIATLTSQMTRDAILDRLLAGNHTTAGSVGAQLLKIDALMRAEDYVEPDNDAATDAAEAATSAAAGVVTLLQLLTEERAENLDAPISSRAEPGDNMGLTGSALAALTAEGFQPIIISPSTNTGIIEITRGDDYLDIDSRSFRRNYSGPSLDGAILTFRASRRGEIFERSFTYDAETEQVVIEFTHAQTSNLTPQTWVYRLLVQLAGSGNRASIEDGQMVVSDLP